MFKFKRGGPDGMERYYFKPWYIKAWRYIRWRPLSILEFCWYVLCWGAHGFQPIHEKHVCEDTGKGFELNWNRRQVLKHHWAMARSSYCYNAGLFLTIKEVMYELKTGKHFTEMYKEPVQGEDTQGQD